MFDSMIFYEVYLLAGGDFIIESSALFLFLTVHVWNKCHHDTNSSEQIKVIHIDNRFKNDEALYSLPCFVIRI